MPAIGQNLMGEPCVLPAVLADQSHVRNVNGRFLLENAALDIPLGICAGVALDHLNALNDDPLVFRHNDEHAPGFSPVFAVQDVNLIILFD